MKNFNKVNIFVILGISLVLLLNSGGSSIYGQIVGETNHTNQTNGQNNTQQLGQQLEQANRQLALANQTQQQVSNQTQQQLLTQANQTNGQNNTQQLGQQLEQANRQLAQANQTQQQPTQANQTQPQVSNQTQQQPTQANQTQPQVSSQSKQQDPKMNEKLLNLTNIAILALNDDNTSAAQDSLVLIQNALINASGEQVIIIPAPAIASSDGDDSD